MEILFYSKLCQIGSYKVNKYYSRPCIDCSLVGKKKCKKTVPICYDHRNCGPSTLIIDK